MQSVLVNNQKTSNVPHYLHHPFFMVLQSMLLHQVAAPIQHMTGSTLGHYNMALAQTLPGSALEHSLQLMTAGFSSAYRPTYSNSVRNSNRHISVVCTSETSLSSGWSTKVTVGKVRSKMAWTV
jgi:hypothetical protein